jgi:SAM-dependent methyltransferase
MTVAAQTTSQSALLPRENHYGHTKKLRFILDAIAAQQRRLGRRARVLDFGCGNGAAVSQYIIKIGCAYVGVDIHEPSLTYATMHFGGEHVRFCNAIPAGEQFDVIVYSDFLEHVDDPAAVLQAHTQFLATDGIVVASVPNGYGPFEIEQWLDKTFRLSKGLEALSSVKRRLLGRLQPGDTVGLPYNHDSGHLVFFTRTMLRDVAAKSGLRIARFAHGAFIGASISGIALARSARLMAWNTRVADRLPYWSVSTWYFVLGKQA